MKSLRLAWVSFALFVSLAGFARAAPLTGGERDEILRVDQARIEAMIRRDAKAVEASLSNDVVYGHADGRVHTKAQLLEALASNQIQYQVIHYTSQDAYSVGDTRVVSGVADFEAISAGKPVKFTLRITAVYLREAGQWRLGVYQSTPVR